METLEQTRQKLIRDDIAVIEQTIRRLKLKRAKLLGELAFHQHGDDLKMEEQLTFEFRPYPSFSPR